MLDFDKEAYVNYTQCVPKLDGLHYEIPDWRVLTEAGLLNKCSYLARALGVTKILKIKDDFGHTFRSHLDVQQTTSGQFISFLLFFFFALPFCMLWSLSWPLRGHQSFANDAFSGGK
jgi:hypothetical protein